MKITKEEISVANKKLRATYKSIVAHPLVRDVSIERDGVWVYLHDGWCCSATDMNAIAEDTIEEVVYRIKRAYFDASTMD